MTTPREPLPDLDQDQDQGQEPNRDQNDKTSMAGGVVPAEHELDPEGTEPTAYLDGDSGQ
jgi:hypothetical protein